MLENPWRAALKLLHYNGVEPADTYLIQVQLAAQINAWTAEEVTGHIALSLEGKALQLLIDLRQEELGDWMVLKTAIQCRFRRHTHADNARDLLSKCRRGVGESLGACAADLCTYAWRGHPNFGEAVQEELTVQAFIRGLRPERTSTTACPQHSDSGSGRG